GRYGSCSGAAQCDRRRADRHARRNARPPSAMGDTDRTQAARFSSRNRRLGSGRGEDAVKDTVMELICPAGTPAALRIAVEAGADAVYCGFRDETNARNFPGLNFSREELRSGVEFAHARGVKVLVAINTYPRAGALDIWHG